MKQTLHTAIRKGLRHNNRASCRAFLMSKNGIGVFGKRTVSYRDLVYNEKRDDQTYKSVNQLVIDPKSKNQPDEFWNGARHMGLSRSEQGVFEMIEVDKSTPAEAPSGAE